MVGYIKLPVYKQEPFKSMLYVMFRFNNHSRSPKDKFPVNTFLSA